MNRNKKIGLIVGIVAIMIVMIWFISGGGSTTEQVKRRPYVSSNWNKRFQPFDKDPMGLYLFNTLLSSHLDSTKSVFVVQEDHQLDSLLRSDTLPKTYLFIGNDFGLQNREIEKIMNDVEKGSRLFLSYNGLMINIRERIFLKYQERFEYAESINVFAKKKKHHMINLFQNDTLATDWNAFGEVELFGDHTVLSSFMEMSNFIKSEREKGFIYVHSTPIQFYNYQIKRKEGFAYTNFVLNQLPKDQNVYLLELGRLTDNFGNHDVDDQEGTEGKTDTSYLRVIFENKMLLKAMLFGILGLILFIIFRSKRTRPVVPYLEKRKNMTLAFAETITSIYFHKKNPYGMLQVQRKNFYAMMQKHFFVDLSRREGERELQMLAKKSDHTLEEIKELLAKLETKEAFSVTEATVAEVDRMKRKFYQDTGIITDKILDRLAKETMSFNRTLIWPLIFLLGGIAAIMVGFYLLVKAFGIGIVLWPVGLLAVAMGILRLRNPLLKMTPEKIIYFSPWGRKRIYLRIDLLRTVPKASGVVFHFTNNRTLIINYADMSSFDRKQFRQLVSKFEFNEL